jgi:hypothetical protein
MDDFSENNPIIPLSPGACLREVQQCRANAGERAGVRWDFTLFVDNEAVMKHYIEFCFFQKIL